MSDARSDGTQVRRQAGEVSVVLHRLRLEVIEGPDRGRDVELKGAHLRIGTAPSSDLALSDRTVSRHHAEVVAEGERYVLRDLGSTNGSFVGDTRVTEAFLEPGARVRVGDTVLAFSPKKKWQRVDAREVESFGELTGHARSMREAMALLRTIAPTDLSCLVLGETGTGKELAARGLHAEGARRGGPFVVVDCGAVSATLIESELFGHDKGAFTGADRARPGAFEAAHGGTLFLDEIGELPIDLQPKLLRALERREIKRLGSQTPVQLDVRVVAATHRDLLAMTARDAFRQDLYYRLAEVVVILPSLRDRRDDVGPLARRMVSLEASRLGRTRTMSDECIEALASLPWAGNARELRNVIRRLVALSPSETITRDDLARLSPELLGAITADAIAVLPAIAAPLAAAPPSSAARAEAPELAGTLKDARERWNRRFERAYVEALLGRVGGDLDRAAAEADVHRKTLERLVRELGLR